MTTKPLDPRRSRFTRATGVVAASAVVALALSACGTPDEESAATTTQATENTSTSEEANDTEANGATQDAEATAASEDTANEAGAPSDDTVVSMLNGGAAVGPSQEAPSGHMLSVTDVRVGDHDGFDRVVLEFVGEGDPGWFADFTAEPQQQGSGFPIEYTGDVALGLMATGVGLPFDTGVDGVPTGLLEGSTAGDITGVTHNGIFEGQAQFVIGLNGEPRPYTVNVLHEPTRLVIDIEDQ